MSPRPLPSLLSVAVSLAACGSDRVAAVAPSGPFRLIAPLSTATVSSRRPTLRWAPAAGTDGMHVQICRDRACSHEVAAFDASGPSGVPPNELPAGLLFWRVFGRSGSATSTVASATWELTVGARSAPVDTSWGTTLDVNGDGYADVVHGSNVYLGSAAGTPATPSMALAPLDNQSGGFYASAESAGDVNGDGYADFVVRDGSAPSPTDAAYVYLGSPSGLPPNPSTTLLGRVANFAYIGAAASAGDVDGDGYADLVVGDPTTTVGTASIYLGSAAGPSTTPAVILSNPAGFFGAFVAGAGDVNGDGYGDVIVGDVGSSVNDTPPSALAYVYLGGANGLSTTPVAALTRPDGSAFYGCCASSAGDVNGDGYADILVGVPVGPNGGAYLYLGGPAGPSASPSVAFGGVDSAFGSALAAGDLNGDGYADLVIGDPGFRPGGDAPGTPDNKGVVFVYLGGPTGPATTPSLTLANPDPVGFLNTFGQVLVTPGDVNGDGYTDLAALAPWVPGGYIFLGAAGGPAATPASALQ